MRLTLSDCLSSVGVEEHSLVLPADGTNLLDGLDGTNLVVEHHDLEEGMCVSRWAGEGWRIATHGDEASVGADGRLEELEVYQTVGLYRQVGDLESLVLENSARIKNTLVLSLRRDATGGVSSAPLWWRVEWRAHMCFFLPLKNRAMPLTLMLLDSVAPLVKMMSLGFAPMRSDTYCKRAVCQLMSSAGQHAGTHLPSILYGLLRLPAIRVRLAVGIPVLVRHEGHHGVEDPRVGGRRRLHVEVDGPSHLLSHRCSILRELVDLEPEHVLARGDYEGLGRVDVEALGEREVRDGGKRVVARGSEASDRGVRRRECGGKEGGGAVECAAAGGSCEAAERLE
jgi:hypothetical protein